MKVTLAESTDVGRADFVPGRRGRVTFVEVDVGGRLVVATAEKLDVIRALVKRRLVEERAPGVGALDSAAVVVVVVVFKVVGTVEDTVVTMIRGRVVVFLATLNFWVLGMRTLTVVVVGEAMGAVMVVCADEEKEGMAVDVISVWRTSVLLST